MRAFVGSVAVVAGISAVLATFLNPSQAAGEKNRIDAPIVYGGCETNAQAFAVATKPAVSRRNGVVTLLPERITFTQGKPGCVLVAFTAENNSGGIALQLRPLLDGDPTAMPEVVQLIMATNLNTHGMNFVFTDVPVGRHVLRFEFAAVGGPNSVTLQKRSTIVSYTR